MVRMKKKKLQKKLNKFYELSDQLLREVKRRIVKELTKPE